MLPKTPWFTDMLKSAKTIRRNAERTWQRMSNWWTLKYTKIAVEKLKHCFSNTSITSNTPIYGNGKCQMKLFRLTKVGIGSNWNTLFTNTALLNTISSVGQRQAAEQSFLIPQIISKRAFKHTQISFITLLKLRRRRSST